MKYLYKISNIVKGWYYLLRLLLLKKEEYKEANARRQICNGCVNKTRLNTCKACGCFIPAKVLVEYEECPKGYW